MQKNISCIQVDSHYCPNCMENLPSSEVRLKKNKYVYSRVLVYMRDEIIQLLLNNDVLIDVPTASTALAVFKRYLQERD